MALRVFPQLIYGEDHAYGQSFTGTGTEDSVSNLSRQDLLSFTSSWVKPNNSTLVVVGDTSINVLLPILESSFRDWQPGDVPVKNIGDVTHRSSPSVYIIDRPDSLQSVIFAGHVAPAIDDSTEIAIGAMNAIIGGSFTSRINMNLREDKGWSYGARTILGRANRQRPFYVRAPVQTDRTAESMQEVVNELRGFIDDSPATRDEVQKTQDNLSLRLAGRWETNASVGNSISEIVRFGYDDDYYNSYAERVNALNVEDVAEAARQIVRPENAVWVIVGDRSKIEADIRALNIGEVHLLDVDGNIIDD
jgi:zinc protease